MDRVVHMLLTMWCMYGEHKLCNSWSVLLHMKLIFTDIHLLTIICQICRLHYANRAYELKWIGKLLDRQQYALQVRAYLAVKILFNNASLLPTLLQHCLYPTLILPSVRQEPAATHCFLCSVSHITALCLCSTELLSVLPSLLASVSIYVFKQHWQDGRQQCRWRWSVRGTYGAVHACLCCNCVHT